jgi:hypothetical protein
LITELQIRSHELYRNQDPELLRKRYFDQPLEVIEHGGQIPEGNGAIIALMAVFPLYERYLTDAFNRRVPDGTTFEQFRARDLGLPENPTTDADQFWNAFRDGLSHGGMPFEDSKTAQKPKNKWTLPKVSLDGRHPDLPAFRKTRTGERVICLNPWGFVRHVLNKYETDPSIFTRDTDSPLLVLSLIPAENTNA